MESLTSHTAEELVFSVHDAKAVRAASISLSEAGLLERDHLQEWVVEHPAILGPDTMVVTTELDQFADWRGQPERERLDVLGLHSDGRLVVAELKRGSAPSPTTLQAMNYAARVSRLLPEDLAVHHAKFLSQRGERVTDEEARERLDAHVRGLEIDADLLPSPRIVIVAASFPTSLTSMVVWLAQQGLDISLQQLRAYRLSSGEMVITVSRLFPVQEVDELTIVARPRTSAQASLPNQPWTVDDLRRLRTVTDNPATLSLLNLCAESPGTWISFTDVIERAGRSHAECRGALARLTLIAKQQFGRSNWPVEAAASSEEYGGVAYQGDADFARAWDESSQPASTN